MGKLLRMVGRWIGLDLLTFEGPEENDPMTGAADS